MSNESESPNMMEALKQKNRKSLNGIEMSLGETKIISIPTQVREEEMNLLRTAVKFQPELYAQIAEIPTREEMDKYMDQVINIDMDYYQRTVDAYRKELTEIKTEIISKMEQTERNIQAIQSQMMENIERAGKAQESFMSNTLQKGQELEQAIAAQVKKAGVITAVKWIAISVLSSAASTLLLHLLLK